MKQPQEKRPSQGEIGKFAQELISYCGDRKRLEAKQNQLTRKQEQLKEEKERLEAKTGQIFNSIPDRVNLSDVSEEARLNAIKEEFESKDFEVEDLKKEIITILQQNSDPYAANNVIEFINRDMNNMLNNRDDQNTLSPQDGIDELTDSMHATRGSSITDLAEIDSYAKSGKLTLQGAWDSEDLTEGCKKAIKDQEDKINQDNQKVDADLNKEKADLNKEKRLNKAFKDLFGISRSPSPNASSPSRETATLKKINGRSHSPTI